MQIRMEGRTGSTELSLTSTFVWWHAYSYTCVHTLMHAYTCMHAHTHTHGVLHMYTQTHTPYTHSYTQTHTPAHTFMHTLLYTHTFIHIHTYTLLDTQTYTSTFTHRLKTGTEMSQTSDNLLDHLVGHTRAKTST